MRDGGLSLLFQDHLRKQIGSSLIDFKCFFPKALIQELPINVP
jgi:hypothetical protein